MKKIFVSFLTLSLLLSIEACSKEIVNSSSSFTSSLDKTSEVSIDSSLEESSSFASSSSEEEICTNHLFGEEMASYPSIIKKTERYHICEKCGYKEVISESYNLDEFVYLDKEYMYDGKERELLIEGMIPYGCSISYQNNKRTELGEQEATANIYDSNGNLLTSKKAKLKIVENTGLANIRVNTTTGEDPDYKDKTNYTKMTASIDNCEDKYVLNDLTGGIRARGNSTNYDDVSKRPWRLKFDSKVNLLGLNNGQEYKSWVLLAEYFDQSLMRNITAFNMGNSLFNYSNNYASSYKHVNFYMNDEYRGVYVLAEQQQANSGRIDIKEPSSNNNNEKVGYLVEIDIRADDDDYYFTCGPKSQRSPWGTWSGGIMINGVRVVSSTYAIKSDTNVEAQNKYIEKYIANAMDALISAVKDNKLLVIDENNNLVDSPYDNQYDTLNSFIDLESLFKTCLIHELMKNYDVGFGSFYLFIDFSSSSKYPRLTFGAPWDFDLSSGNKQSGDIIKTNNEFIKKGFGEANFNPWLYLFSQLDFYDELIKKYYAVFNDSGVFDNAINEINYLTSAFATAFDDNVTCWKNGTAKTRMQNRSYNNHKDAVDYLLNWLKNRKAYMDSVYLQ